MQGTAYTKRNSTTPKKPPTPTESVEQQLLFRWAQWMEHMHPELRLLHHIPNGGVRNKATAGRLRAEGVKSGVPDLCLPVARKGFHGLYIEMKRIGGKKPPPEQEIWMHELSLQGYYTHVCYGHEQARDLILEYLGK